MADTAHDIATIEERGAISAPMQTGDAFLDIISRAVDQGASVETIERLYSLKEKMNADRAEVAFSDAMSEMQPELPVISHTKKVAYFSKKLNKHIQKNTYTPWEDIDERVRPIYARHGFSLSFKIDQSKDKQISVTAVVRHRDGHSEKTTIDLPISADGEMNAAQAVASALTYGKRYSACAALNITTRDSKGRSEDDDGRSTGPIPDEVRSEFIDENQCEIIRDKLAVCKRSEVRFCKGHRCSL